MNDNKLQKLCELARSEAAPVPPARFDSRVLAAVRRESRLSPVSLFEQFGRLFPRLALAAALVIALCVAADFCFSELDSTSITTGAAQISEQWLFAANEP